jgi:hypothetical protein
MWLPRSFIVLLFAALTTGALTNKTIDDTSSQFFFSTPNWAGVTPENPCGYCSSRPPDSYNQTYHDGNYGPSSSSLTTGSFTFTGSAVYIFGIDQANTMPDISFTLNGETQVHHYTGTEQYVPNALFFSAEGLASGTYTVNWVFKLDPTTGVSIQDALFDYAIVTSGEEDPPPTTPAVQPIQTQGSSNPQSSSPTVNTNNNSQASSKPSNTISNPAPSGSGASQSNSGASQSNSGASHSSGASQLNPSNPTASGSPANQGLGLGTSATVTVSGMTTVTAVSASSQSKSNMGAIIGGVLGGLVVAIVLGVLFLWTRRRRARRVKSQADTAVRPQSQFLRVEDYPARARQASNAFPVSMPTSRPKGSLAGPSTVSLLTPHEDPSADSPTAPNSDGAPSTMGDSPIVENAPPQNTTSHRDMQWMEERLAALEAQVAGPFHQQPPPYVHEDEDD